MVLGFRGSGNKDDMNEICAWLVVSTLSLTPKFKCHE